MGADRNHPCSHKLQLRRGFIRVYVQRWPKLLKTSYIKFSVGHKLGCAMTPGLRVPNDIYQLWLELCSGFHWGQGFLIYLLSWWRTWVRVRDLLQRPVVSWITTENCNWIHVPGFSLSFFGLSEAILFSFSAPYVLLPIAQRWSGSWLLISNHIVGWCRFKYSCGPNTYMHVGMNLKSTVL